MVVQFAKEHLVCEALPGLVLLDGRPQFLLMPAKRVPDNLLIGYLIETARIAKPVDLIEVFLRVEASASHHFLKLPVAECETNRERVDFLLLALSHFCISIHRLFSPNLCHVS